MRFQRKDEKTFKKVWWNEFTELTFAAPNKQYVISINP